MGLRPVPPKWYTYPCGGALGSAAGGKGKQGMIANYHTHTVRCRHARGTEREYIETGIARGLKKLGFSDHSPHIVPGGYVSPTRMTPDEAEGYFDTLRSLRDEYGDRIEIPIGLELEYYPQSFERTVRFLRGLGPEYLILGQHMMGDEPSAPHCGEATGDEKLLDRYVGLMCEAMDTGMYTYVAHPDMFNFRGESALYREAAEKLCAHARDRGIPVEFNLLGYSEKRWYPREEMALAARDTGCAVVIGCDAHSPDRVAMESEVEGALCYLRSLGIEPLGDVRIVSPFGSGKGE